MIGCRTKLFVQCLTPKSRSFPGLFVTFHAEAKTVNLTTRTPLALAAILVLVFSAGCSDRNPTELPTARGTIDPLVYDDDYGADVYFQAFSLTHVAAVSQDSVYAYGGQAIDGARSLKINVPPAGSSLGLYSGGVLTSAASRDMADFNALTFYARTNNPVMLDVVGFGNDNTGNSLYEAGRNNIALTSDWTFVVVPIPEPSKLISERGMFTFAEGLEAAYPQGYDIWIDEIRFAKLGNINVFRPSFTSGTKPYFVGSTVNIDGTRTIFQIDGAYVPVDHSLHYFDFITSDPAVAVVSGSQVRVVGTGTASITALLGETEVQGRIDVTGYEPPTTAAPAPTLPAGDVISLFSDTYNDVPVDTWRADWGGVTTQVQDYRIAGNDMKLYSSLNWVGIDFQSVKVDASEMTHFHMDVYGPAGTSFKVKLVSFPDGAAGLQTTDLELTSSSTPAYNPGGWSSLDIPLENFTLPASGWNWATLGQLVLSSGDTKLVLVDNVYWHK